MGTSEPCPNVAHGLLPCPFCGGKAKVVDLNANVGGFSLNSTRMAVACESCGVVMEQRGGIQSVMTWNRRAERTCSNLDGAYNHKRAFHCSVCGYDTDTYGDSDCDPSAFRWCPSCGAKVVVGDE